MQLRSSAAHDEEQQEMGRSSKKREKEEEEVQEEKGGSGVKKARKEEEGERFVAALREHVRGVMAPRVLGEKDLGKMLGRRFYGPMNWLALYRVVKENGGQVELVPGLAKAYLKAAKIEGANEKNAKRNGHRLKEMFRDLHLEDFQFDEDTSKGMDEDEETESDVEVVEEEEVEDLDMFLQISQKVDRLEKEVTKSRGKATFSEFKKCIAQIKDHDEDMNSGSEFKLLFYGRSGAGKSTLINLLLFASCFKQLYKKKNTDSENLDSLNLLCRRWHESGKDDREVNNAKTFLISEINGGDASAEQEKPELCSNVFIFLNEKGLSENERDQEFRDLSFLVHPTPENRIIKPFVLDSAGANAKGSCSTHTVCVRHGARWQALLSYFSLDELMDALFPESGVSLDCYKDLYKMEQGTQVDLEFRYEMWQALSSFRPSEEKPSSSSFSSSPKIPSNKNEAIQLVSLSAKEFFGKSRFELLLGKGDHFTDDRAFIRDLLKKRINEFKFFIKNIDLFAPSILLSQDICWVDAPGVDDSSVFNRRQLSSACETADGIVLVSLGSLAVGTNLNRFAETFGAEILAKNEFPLFIALRTMGDNIDTPEQLPGLEEKEKDREVSVKELRRSFMNYIFQESKQTKQEMERMQEVLDESLKTNAKQSRFKGGSFLYMRPALSVLCKNIRKENRADVFERSSFADLVSFLRPNSGIQISRLLSTKLNSAIDIFNDTVKRLGEENESGERLFRLVSKTKNINASLLDIFNDILDKHSYLGQGLKGKASGALEKLSGAYQDVARTLSIKISDSVKGMDYGALPPRTRFLFKSEESFRTVTSPTVAEGGENEESYLYEKMIKPHFNKDLLKDISPVLEMEIYAEFVECALSAIKQSLLGVELENIPLDVKNYVDNELANARSKVREECNKEFKHELQIYRKIQKELRSHLLKNLFGAISGSIKNKPFDPKIWFARLCEEICQRFSEKELIPIFDGVYKTFILGGLNAATNALVKRIRNPILKQVSKQIVKQAGLTSTTISTEAKSLIKEILNDLHLAIDAVNGPENNDLLEVLSLDHRVELLGEDLFEAGQDHRLGGKLSSPTRLLKAEEIFNASLASFRLGEVPNDTKFLTEESLNFQVSRQFFQLLPHSGPPTTRLNYLLRAILLVLKHPGSKSDDTVGKLRTSLIKMICQTYLDDSMGFKKKFGETLVNYIDCLESTTASDKSISVLPIFEAFTTFWKSSFSVEILVFDSRQDLKKIKTYLIPPPASRSKGAMSSFKFALDSRNDVFYALQLAKTTRA